MALENTNWDDLRVFLAVARSGNLDAASDQLSLDPTTLGRRLRRLEQALGTALFERSRRGHRLTNAGEWMVRQVENIEHTMYQVEGEIAGEADRLQGTVRLSVTEGFGNAIIAPALAGLAAQYPELNIELIATSGLLNVSKREADLAVVLSRPTTGRLKVSKLTDYELKLYASKAYLKRASPISTIADLHNHTLIGYVDDLIYSPKLRYYAEIDPNLAPTLCSSSLLAQARMVSAGAGIAMLPRFLADSDKDLKLVLPDTVSVTRSFWLAVHEDVADFARIRVVVEFLRELQL
ncbi:MAG: LysR family transcriptional regulator [Pseudomonadales bacterium]|nr:LysR family transcriptional regulator [Pseudomonadales bacterium]